MTPSITQDDVFEALRSFLLAIVPDGTEIIQAQDNRVPEPLVGDFVTITPLRRQRLTTNVDGSEDALFVGSIAATTMTITDVRFGELAVGRRIFGIGVAPATTVTAFVSGSGGVGTYAVSPPQTVGSVALAAGEQSLMQETMFSVQLDVHGDSGGDTAQVISTMFRDAYACDFFAAIDPAIAPLYADDPHQAPFLNSEQQYENRWVVEVALQINPVILVAQQYAGALEVDIISVDAVFPP